MKAMVVTSSRLEASIYGDCLKSKECLDDDEVEVLFSDVGKDNNKLIRKFGKSKSERNNVRVNFADPNKNPKITVVCDMLLTGFDAPILRTIYLDRDFEGGHSLLQVIARTNRNREGKSFGEVIDYSGVITDFEDMVNYSTEEIEKFKTEGKEDFADEFKNKVINIRKEYFSEKLQEDIKNFNASVEDCLDELNSIVKQGNFVQDFKELRVLYENVKPHKTIAKYNDEFKIYETIHDYYDKDVDNQKQESAIEQNKDIVINSIENNSEHRVKESNFKIRVEGIESDNSVKVTEKYVNVTSFIDNNKEKIPKYDSLSEKIEEIINKWNKNNKSNEETIKELEKVYENVESKVKEFEKSSLTPKQEIFNSILSEELEKEDTEEIAVNITDRLRDSGFDKLERINQDQLDNINSMILEELGKYDIVKEVSLSTVKEMRDKYISIG